MRWLVLANYVRCNSFPEMAACTQRCHRKLRKWP